MKKTIFLFLVFFCAINIIFALYSDEFLIGAYSIKNREITVDNKWYNITDKVIERLADAHYNCVQATNWTNYYYWNDEHTFKFSDILTSLNANHIDANVHDGFHPHERNGKYSLSNPGIEFQTSSCYFRFESEYQNKSQTVIKGDLNDDAFFYRFQQDSLQKTVPSVGELELNSGYSHGAAWSCKPSPASYSNSWKTISRDIYQRWADSSDLTRLTGICKFAQDYEPALQESYLAGNRLHIRVAMKWIPITNANDPHYNDAIIKITFMGRTVSKDNPIQLNFVPDNTAYGTILRISDWGKGTNDPLNNNSGFRVFSYSISLAELDAPSGNESNSVLQDHCWLMYLVPVVQWNQSRTVSLDYIEYEDDVHIALKDKARLDEWVKNRLTNNYAYRNIANYWGINEPFPANFDSFKLIQQSITTLGGMTNHPIANSIQPWFICMKPDATYFSNIRNYNHYAKPLIQMINRYPLNNSTDFNNESSPNFIQVKLDRALTDYQVAKEEKIPFYAAVQSYGDWGNPKDPNSPFWYDKLYPSSTVQKCLQYLPLCFGPAGIIDFPLTIGNQSEITPLVYTPILDPRPSYDALKEANAKLIVYGPIVKKSVWFGSKCIKAGAGLAMDFTSAAHHFCRMTVDKDLKDDAPYYGYIQCGFFHSGNENYYMLVNRRTDIFTGNRSYPDPRHTQITDYSQAYKIMSSQTVKLTILANGSITSFYGPSQGLYDPFTHEIIPFQGGIAKIPIDPGEATLRRIVAVLPNNINNKYAVNRNIYSISDVNIHDGGVVTIQPNTTLYISSNTKIYITKGSTLRILGNLTAGDSSKIIVETGSTLDISKASTQWGKGAGIEKVSPQIKK